MKTKVTHMFLIFLVLHTQLLSSSLFEDKEALINNHVLLTLYPSPDYL